MGDILRTETWWTPGQLSLVEDAHRNWHRATFEPSDMLLVGREMGQGSIGRQAYPSEQTDQDGEIVKAGWDHAHCELCWTTVSAAGANQHDGYTDGKAWLCISCFDTYIAPRLRK